MSYIVSPPGGGIEAVSVVPTRLLFEDYRDVEGVRIPFRIITENAVAGRAVIQFDEVAVRLERDNELFTPRSNPGDSPF